MIYEHPSKQLTSVFKQLKSFCFLGFVPQTLYPVSVLRKIEIFSFQSFNKYLLHVCEQALEQLFQ